jgi:hypothetical protein
MPKQLVQSSTCWQHSDVRYLDIQVIEAAAVHSCCYVTTSQNKVLCTVPLDIPSLARCSVDAERKSFYIHKCIHKAALKNTNLVFMRVPRDFAVPAGAPTACIAKHRICPFSKENQ